MRRLIGAALALVIVGGAGQAMSKTPAHPSAGVTTLEPAGGDGWRPSEDPGDSFTPVGVIGGRGLNEDADPSGPLNIAPPEAIAARASDPSKPPPVVKGAANWLPEPATWVLLLIGLAMIGFALRGLVAARRRLTRLEETEP